MKLTQKRGVSYGEFLGVETTLTHDKLKRHSGWRCGAGNCALALAVFVLGIAPLCAHNLDTRATSIATNHIELMAQRTGSNFYAQMNDTSVTLVTTEEAAPLDLPLPLSFKCHDDFGGNDTGWPESSAWAGNMVVTTGSVAVPLIYSNAAVYAHGGSNAVKITADVTGTSSSAYKRSIPQQTNTFYISFLARYKSAALSTWDYIGCGQKVTGGDTGAALGHVDASSVRGAAYIKDGSTKAPLGSANPQANVTYMLVAKYTWDESTKAFTSLTAYLNPLSASNELAEASATVSGSVIAPFSSVDFQYYGKVDADFDEIRVGRTWADVVPGIPPARLYGYAYQDKDTSLTRSIGDGSASGMVVQVWLDDVQVASTNAAANGFYEFTGLVPETYEVRFICNTNALTAIPKEGEAATNPERNRAVATAQGYAVATYALYSGHGIGDDKGEPINAGFTGGGPMSSGIDLRAYQGADGVYVEFVAYDVEEDGTIRLCLLDPDGKPLWEGAVDVLAGPRQVCRFLVPGLVLGNMYNFEIYDEAGNFWEASDVTVGTFAIEMVRMSLAGVTLAFESLPDREYDIQWTPRLGIAWQTVTNVPSQGTRTTVIVAHPDPTSPSGFFRIVIK